ncbi:MAG: DUF1800 domain-containing protein [Candidatus Hydrogenedentota bacterium]
MKLTRRTFLQMLSGTSAAACFGCDQIPFDLGLVVPKVSLPDHSDVPAMATKNRVSHVLDRVTFGPRPGDYGRITGMGVEAYIEEQLSPAVIDDKYCEKAIRRYQTIAYPAGELFEYREHLLWSDLASATVLRAVYSERQLYEVMVGFWSDHFNIDHSKGDCQWLKTADDREVIRKHALGTFPELLRASALSPAMLWYLDGRENRKSSPDEQPNENYGRELLELHTLGVDGGYTQQDVMEVARCLTGWTVRSEEKFWKGRVEFRAENHDDGEKTVLSEMIPAGLGEEDLDRVLAIVSGHPSTARYLATKLCTRFISDDPDGAAIDAVALAYSGSGGDIPTMLRALFATDAFWISSDQKIKRPIRFVASALRATGATTNGGSELLEYVVRMGQSPFSYPTPDGYPDEAEPWMGTLMWRWHFGVALKRNSIPGTSVDWEKLAELHGDDRRMMAGMLGRQPSAEEESGFHASGIGPAFILASPGFQRC